MRNLWVKGIPQKEQRKPIFGVGIFDSDYSCYSDKIKDSYFCWVRMLRRCYDSKYHKRKPTYENCCVCDKWIYFSNFNSWFDKNYVKGYHLDKDILVKGNKVYSPETCCFVPQEINTLLLNDKGKRDEDKKSLPVGVTETKYSYRARFNQNGNIVNLGMFKTKEAAFLAYKNAKESYIKELAKEYFGNGKITKEVYDALMKYEIEIND